MSHTPDRPDRSSETEPWGELVLLPFGHILDRWSDRFPSDADAEAADRERRREQLEAERHAAMTRLARRGVPVKDLARILDAALEPSDALVALQRFHDAYRADPLGAHRLVILSGPRGRGKTTAAAWWIAQTHPGHPYLRTQPPMFIKASALLRLSRYDDADMERVHRASALAIDELGAEYDDRHGAARQLVADIVDARYDACLPTVVCTNLPPQDVRDPDGIRAGFRTRYGARVWDRIVEAGQFIGVTGPSLRMPR